LSYSCFAAEYNVSGPPTNRKSNPDDLNSEPEWTGVRSRLVPAPTPPLCALYSGAASKLRAGGDDCLTAANEGGNVLGKRLTASELFEASAVCRARRHCDQREHHADSHRTNHHSLHSPCADRLRVHITDSDSHYGWSTSCSHLKTYPFVRLPSLRAVAQRCKRAFGHFIAISTPPTAADNSTPTLTPRN
jgi:hypothetical protein